MDVVVVLFNFPLVSLRRLRVSHVDILRPATLRMVGAGGGVLGPASGVTSTVKGRGAGGAVGVMMRTYLTVLMSLCQYRGACCVGWCTGLRKM